MARTHFIRTRQKPAVNPLDEHLREMTAEAFSSVVSAVGYVAVRQLTRDLERILQSKESAPVVLHRIRLRIQAQRLEMSKLYQERLKHVIPQE